MRVVRDWEKVDFRKVVLTIGNFDGVHRGHQAILAAGRRLADHAHAELIVMTFDPHPLAVLTPNHVPAVLTPLDRKLELLKQAGVNAVALVQSGEAFLNVTAEQFLSDVILTRLNPVAIVEGASFRFGRQRQGNVATLRAAAKTYGFKVVVVEPIRTSLGGHPETVISSSLVRQLVRSGTVDQVAHCLGRPYTLFGQVGHGSERGRTLGYPTANIKPADQLIPAEGVYAGRCVLQGQRTPAAVSIGNNPTFDGHAIVVEAHILDYTGDLYGAGIEIEFLDWLRPQQEFESAQALRKQITADVARTREAFKAHLADF